MKLEKEKVSLFYKRGIYESYLKSVGKCIACWNETSLREYGEIYPLALMYFPENLQPSIISLDELISKQNWNNATTSLNELAPKIRTILQNM